MCFACHCKVQKVIPNKEEKKRDSHDDYGNVRQRKVKQKWQRVCQLKT